MKLWLTPTGPDAIYCLFPCKFGTDVQHRQELNLFPWLNCGHLCEKIFSGRHTDKKVQIESSTAGPCIHRANSA